MVKEANAIDEKNGVTLWQDAIQKEMEYFKIAFQTIHKGQKSPNGFQYVNCHMHLVAGGHMTHTPETITYSSVVRETVCIACIMAASHDLEVKASDLLNTCMASNREKVWTKWGPEFRDDAGESAIFVRALYSLNSAGASFRTHLAQCMHELGYYTCDADPDLWTKAENSSEDKLEHYSYNLCYVDDILCIHHDPDDILNKLCVHVIEIWFSWKSWHVFGHKA